MSDEESNDAAGSEGSGYNVYCSLCKTRFSSTVTYRQHLKGSKHAKAEKKDYMKQKYGKKYNEAVSKLHGKEPEAVESEKSAKDDDDAEVYTCELCKKVCTGIANYNSHLAGQPHAKQLKKRKIMQQLQSKVEFPKAGDVKDKKDSAEEALYETVPQLKPFAHCSQCQKSFSGPEGYNQHIASETHRKTLQKLKLAETAKNGVETRNLSEDSDDMEPAPFAICGDCNKSFEGPVPYQQHMISAAHKKQVKKRLLMEKVKHMAIESGEEGFVKCAECGKIFGDPLALYKHLNGPTHAKQKEKDQLLQDLLAKFPELLKDTKANAALSDSESDDGDFLACAVCHKCFTGPESARDHFRSKKHQKTVREKKRIEKLMKKQKEGKSETVHRDHDSSLARDESAEYEDDFEVIG